MEKREINLIQLYQERKSSDSSNNESIIINKLSNVFPLYDKKTACALVDYYIRTYGQDLYASGF